MLGSSFENSILIAIRQNCIGYGDALSVILDSRLRNPPKRQLIRANTPRGRLLQRLFSLGPCRLVPDPQEDGWVYKGPSSYALRIESYAEEAEAVLSRLVRLQGCLADRASSEDIVFKGF